MRSAVMHGQPAGSTVFFACDVAGARHGYSQMYRKPNLVMLNASVADMVLLTRALRADGCRCPILCLTDDLDAAVTLRESGCTLAVSAVAFVMYCSRFFRLLMPDKTIDDEMANAVFLLRLDEEGIVKLPAVVSLPPGGGR